MTATDDGTSAAGSTGAVVAAATLVAFAMIAQQVAATATRDAFFLTHYPATALPPVMAGAVALSFAVVLLLSRLLARFSPARVAPCFFALNGVLFAGEWLLARSVPREASVVVFLHTAALGAALISCFWSLVSEKFDPHTAKKVIARIAGGASLGGVVGGATAWAAGNALPLTSMLLILAGINGVCALGVLRVSGRGQPPAAPADEVGPRASGLKLLRTVPYLRQLGLLILLSTFVEVTVDYVFKARAADRFATSAQLISFFSIFYTAMGLVSFVLQTALAQRSLEAVGLIGTAATRAVAATIGTVAALLFPGVWSITALRGSEGALKTSLFSSGYELFYTPLTPDKKRPTKTIIDVGCNRLGGLAGIGVTMAAIAALPSYTDTAIITIAFGAALSALLVLALLHSGYVAALAESLKEGSLRLDDEELVDATTRKTWVETTRALRRDVMLRELALRRKRSAEQAAVEDAPLVDTSAALLSGDSERIRAALSAEPDARLASLVILLLERPDVQADARAALEKLAPRITGQLVDVLLDDRAAPMVRRTIARILARSPTQRATDGLVLALADDSRSLRVACGEALASIAEAAPSVALPRNAVLAAATRAAEFDAGAPNADQHLGHVFGLLSLVLEREPLRLAQRALASSDPRLRGTGLEYLQNVLPKSIRDVLWPRLPGAGASPGTTRPREELAEELLRSFAEPSQGRPRS